MKKKSLNGFIKTRHFSQRQKQRKVSDQDIEEAIIKGSLLENEHGHNFLLNHLQVTVDLNNLTLITVHPGDKPCRAEKLLSKVEARRIKQLIDAHELLKKKSDTQPEENEFLKYVSDFSVKKI
jgi:hypothetical protein